eukprot:TRINITY_DN4930_c0_g1_i2.p2 TRINITY_DN4930_c0_g1~~TRINITY_DN4930_c0_g1_i2.p2  ORF type:complete len:304 (+),score=43.36 TRINITY_DN4930_c0_g1_i2:78-989(+)
MSAGRCGRAPAEPPQWLDVDDVFTTVACFLPTFELIQFAASGSQAAAAVRMVTKKHWDAVLELDPFYMDLAQEGSEFHTLLQTTVHTAVGLVQADKSLATLRFYDTVCSYADAVTEICASFGLEYQQPWENNRRKLRGCLRWLRCMLKVDRDRMRRRLRDTGSAASPPRRRGAAPAQRGPAAGGSPRQGAAACCSGREVKARRSSPLQWPPPGPGGGATPSPLRAGGGPPQHLQQQQPGPGRGRRRMASAELRGPLQAGGGPLPPHPQQAGQQQPGPQRARSGRVTSTVRRGPLRAQLGDHHP